MKNIKNITPSELLDYIDIQMKIKNKKQYEILRELAIDSRYIGKIRHQLGRQLRVNNSPIALRIMYCNRILQGWMTIKEVSDITGYTYTTVRNWVKDYKKYGKDMINLANGFSHYKG